MTHRTHLLIISCSCAMVLLGIAFGVQASNDKEATISFPSDPITFQSGAGSQIATTYCLICHSAEYVYTQPPHSREKWEEIIKKMKHTFGCPIPESDIPTLVTYLYGQNEIQPSAKFPKIQKSADVSSPSGTSSVGDSGKGKKIFGTYCVNCHGQSGKGDGPIGKSLVPPAANLTLLGKKSDKNILDTIRKGRPGTAMPSWKGDLSTKDMLDILSYIRTLTP